VGWVLKQWRLEELERLLADDARDALCAVRERADREARRACREADRTAREAARELAGLEALGAELRLTLQRRRGAITAARCEVPVEAPDVAAAAAAWALAAGAGRPAGLEPPALRPAMPLATMPAAGRARPQARPEREAHTAAPATLEPAPTIVPEPLPIPRPNHADGPRSPAPEPGAGEAAHEPRRHSRASLRGSGLSELFRVTDARPVAPPATP
jgi:hypothetical protein